MFGVQLSGRMAAASAFVAVLSVAFALDAQSDGPVIWYRSSEGCPDGEAFLSRLARRAQGARLAQVNDRIDFVVTLGALEGRSSGKLERQTVGSTVAIREIETQSCEEAADVLALTLMLTLNPDSGERWRGRKRGYERNRGLRSSFHRRALHGARSLSFSRGPRGRGARNRPWSRGEGCSRGSRRRRQLRRVDPGVRHERRARAAWRGCRVSLSTP